MHVFAFALFASTALAGGGGGGSVGELPDEPADLLDGQCWTCEMDLEVYGCAGPAIQLIEFEADATSAQGCADELYLQVEDYLATFETCIQAVYNDDFRPFVLTQGAVNAEVSLMAFDANQDVLECDSSTWVPYLEAEPDKYRP